ncbi:hypothetical protein DSM03_11712 [Leeuwenhoekiella aestuarii]|uniref:tail fiber protein n=1 Tax=Leeuwenhoekiella aestuarii TaxID=2249426 RepID=UPI000FFF423C|nr:tail fiber protein [Leeuwenhoekiella aestuarii]RXG11375.1 hypothetical protein DSM03_11712 [Leeuwenhoekiella aestuarii]
MRTNRLEFYVLWILFLMVGVACYSQDQNATGHITLLNNKFIRGFREDGNNLSNLIGFENSGQILAISQYSTVPSEVRIYTPMDVGQGISIFSDKLIAFFKNNGNVGIGLRNPDEKLTVKGNIHSQEVRVDLAGVIAPDYVFKKDYDLIPIAEVEQFIDKEGHLPRIPSAEELERDGLNLKEMNLKLLEKIEELTLYIIEQNKELKSVNQRLNKLEHTNE